VPSPKSKVNVTERNSPASPSIITFQFHPLVVFAFGSAGTCFHVEYTPHPAHKGLN